MTDRISGLPMADIALVFSLSEDALSARHAIRALFAREHIAYIHAYNAAHGCFTARIDRN